MLIDIEKPINTSYQFSISNISEMKRKYHSLSGWWRAISIDIFLSKWGYKLANALDVLHSLFPFSMYGYILR